MSRFFGLETLGEAITAVQHARTYDLSEIKLTYVVGNGLGKDLEVKHICASTITSRQI